MFGGKFQNVWREAKKWQRRVASFFVDRIPYGKFRLRMTSNTSCSQIHSILKRKQAYAFLVNSLYFAFCVLLYWVKEVYDCLCFGYMFRYCIHYAIGNLRFKL